MIRSSHRSAAEPRARSRGRSRGRAGFSLVELVVALMILAVGILGLASTAFVITRQMGGGNTLATAATVAASRLETMASRPCTALANGTATTRGVAQAWTVTTVANARRIDLTVTYQTSRGPRQRVLRSTVSCL